MSRFSHRPLPGNCYAIDDGEKTIATISSQGVVDWLLRTPRDEGHLVELLRKETSLDHTLGVKIELKSQHPKGFLRTLEITPSADGQSIHHKATGETADGAYQSVCDYDLRVEGKGDASRYYWDLAMTIQYVGKEPRLLMDKRPDRQPFLEFTNVYPGKTGRGMFFAKEKEYTHTLISDVDDVVWSFPHQAKWHYGAHLRALQLKVGTFGAFAGFSEGALKTTVLESNLVPTWGICDMYKDLHCSAFAPKTVQPGESFFYRCRIEFVSVAETDALLQKARLIPVTEEIRQRFADVVRFDPGNNSFSNPVYIDRPDETSSFHPSPPEKIWVRRTGLDGQGRAAVDQ